MKIFGLYFVTALAEIMGCYSIYLWLRMGRSVLWVIPGALTLAAFAWLLTLHPTATAGRVYAAYGAVYIAASLAWLWLVEKHIPDRWDLTGGAICLLGAAVICLGPRS